MTKRDLIEDALKEALEQISIDNGYETNLWGNVKKRFIFPEEDPELPLVCVNSGPERINYQPGGFQDRYLTVFIRFYLQSKDDVKEDQAKMLRDLEKVFEDNSKLILSDGSTVRDTRVILIETDQGVLAPLGTGEIQIVVEY